MPSRTFPTYDLEQMIKTQEDYQDTDEVGEPYGPEYKFVDYGTTGQTPVGTDNLGEWCWIVFEVDGVTYKAWYIDGNDYWKKEACDSWDNYFMRSPGGGYPNQDRYQLTEDNQVLCIPVEKIEQVVTKVTYSWVQIPDPES